MDDGLIIILAVIVLSHVAWGWACFRAGRVRKKRINYIEQRRFRRVVPPRSMPVQVQLMGRDVLEVLRIKDISEGGLGIVVPGGLAGVAANSELDLILSLPDEKHIQTKGVIRYGKTGSNGVQEFGVEFSTISAEDRDKVRRYVDKVKPQPIK